MFNISNLVLMNAPSLEGFFTWFTDQAFYVVLIVMIVSMLGLAFKRAWLGMVGVVLGGSLILLFVKTPKAVEAIASWLASVLGI